MDTLTISTDHFHALGTTVEGGIRADPERARAVFSELRRRVALFERRFSRFRHTSELSYVNRSAGRPTRVSNVMLDVLLASRRAWEQSRGFVDPTVGRAVVAAGYDVSFEQLSDKASPPPRAAARRSFADVTIDQAKQQVTLPADTALDFGGLGKGYLLDQLAPLLAASAGDSWYSLGGDLIVSGAGADGAPWSIGVQDPAALDRDLALLRPPVGRWGFATSSVTKRRGIHNGQPWHHLIDPRTGAPSTSDVLAVTVVAPTAFAAEAATKAVLLCGARDGIAWAKQQGDLEALAVTASHELVMTDGMRALLRQP